MLSEVRFRCNHIHMMDLTGQAEERSRKIALYRQVLCPECRAQLAASYNGEISIHHAFVVPAQQMQEM